MEKWKQYRGRDATYNNLIEAFEQASHKDYAEFVKGLLNQIKNVQRDTGNSNRDTTPPPPSTEQSLPVFPPESEQLSESPSYAAAPVVKLQQKLGTKEIYL